MKTLPPPKLFIRVVGALRASETHSMLLWAVAVGFVGALATIAFREAISALQWLVMGRASSFVAMAESLPWYARVALPALGGAFAGLLLQWSRRFNPHSAASDYMEAIAIGDGRIPLREGFMRSGSSLFSVASGGSIGREGSMVHLAELCASVVGRLAKFSPARLRLLVACGAAADITAAYSAPIAGALFVSEIVLGSIAMESFGPLVVASVVANITMRELTPYRPPYEMPPFPSIFGGEVLLFVGVYQRKCYANMLLGRYEAAAPACEQSVALGGDAVTYLYLTAVYAQLGQTAKASSVKEQLLSRWPDFTLERWRLFIASDNKVYWDQVETHLFAGLRKVGIRER